MVHQRTALGKLPTCVQHCEARCLEYGDFEELAERARGQRKVILQAL